MRHGFTTKSTTNILKHTGNLFRKTDKKVKRFLLIPDLQLLRLEAKGKNSIGKEFHCLAVQGKKLLT